MIDIVLSTYNRLDYLERALEGIWDRTTSPYRLHIIDDGSRCETQDYLLALWWDKKLDSLLLRGESRGVAANILAAGTLASSDVVVFTDDDVLCPDVEPDWLARGLAALEADARLGALGLNDPSSNINERRHITGVAGPVTYCKRLGGQFLFVRRRFLREIQESRFESGFLVKELCHYIQDCGFNIGYLTGTYCWHFGANSARTGQDVSDQLLDPVDDKTLAPPEKFRY